MWSHINAISAFQHALRPPPPAAGALDPALFERGRSVFVAAGCAGCHSGPAFTDNRVLPARAVGTEPERAKALEKTREIFDPTPTVWAWDTPVPVPPDATVLEVPQDLRTPEEQRRILGYDGEGGYKVKGLIGLRLSAPYLHMGGVAVGPDRGLDLGLPGTLSRGQLPDPANSLLALIDRTLRERVITANRGDPALAELGILGTGHALWVDPAAGFSEDEQQALVHYLLYLDRDDDPPGATDADGTVGVAAVTWWVSSTDSLSLGAWARNARRAARRGSRSAGRSKKELSAGKGVTGPRSRSRAVSK